MNPTACLIFNPVAGRSQPEQDLAQIQELLTPALELDVILTTPDEDADSCAHQAVEQGANLIIACGGDGTVSAAAGAVINSDIPFGVISRGTANAFANALGIPIDLEAACQTILAGHTRTIDAASCNGKPMTLLTGIGFEAETVQRADRDYKNRFGMLAYVLAGLQELRNLETFETELETDDQIIKAEVAAVTIANVAPPTSVLAQGPGELISDDGLLDVTLVAPNNTLGAIAAAYSLLQTAFRGESADRPDVGFFRTRRIVVRTNPTQKVVVDGELVGVTPLEVVCIPQALRVLVPAPAAHEVPQDNLTEVPNLEVVDKSLERS